jgi:uncharacterized protein (DUF433 family)
MSVINDRITINPEQCGGQPCIRGMRIRVIDILDLLSAGLTVKEIITELPDLEADDIKSAILFARNRINHPIITV